MGTKATTTTIKPTLESVNSLIDHEKRLDDLSLNLGKSVLFNASEYVRLYGAPPTTTPLGVTAGSPARHSSRRTSVGDGRGIDFDRCESDNDDNRRAPSPTPRGSPRSTRSPSRQHHYRSSEQSTGPPRASKQSPDSVVCLQLSGQAASILLWGSPVDEASACSALTTTM